MPIPTHKGGDLTIDSSAATIRRDRQYILPQTGTPKHKFDENSQKYHLHTAHLGGGAIPRIHGKNSERVWGGSAK